MTTVAPIRIVLADDHDLMRTTIEEILSQHTHLQVVASCKNGEHAIEQTLLLQPHFLLVDVVMKQVNGLEVTRRIKEALPETKIIAISSHNNPAYAQAFLELGANGFLTKTSIATELLIALQTINDGGRYLCHEIKAAMQ